MWNKDFVLLAQGQAASCLGDALYSVIVGLWVYDITGSASMMGLVFSAANLSRLLFFPFAGVIVDKFRRRDLIVFCDVLRGVLMLIVGFVSTMETTAAVWILVFYSAVSGACSGVFNPSVNTMMLSITKKENFVRAGSVYNMVEYGVDMIGQGIAGSLYLFFGAPAMFLFNGVTFLFSAITELFISKDEKPKNQEHKPFLQEALEGVRYILGNQGVFCTLLLAFLINFAFGILKVLLVPWMARFGAECYGLLGSFRSAGVVIGTVALAAKNLSNQQRYRVYFWTQIIYVLCVGASSLMSDFWVIAVLFCVAYANQNIFNSLQRSMVIIATPDHLRGKVICAIQALAMGFSALGNLAGGIVSEQSKPEELILFLMLLVLSGVLLFGRHRSVRDMISDQA